MSWPVAVAVAVVFAIVIVSLLLVARRCCSLTKTVSRLDGYRNMLEQNFLGIIYMDFFGKVLYANDIFQKAVGYTLDELRTLQPTVLMDANCAPLFDYGFTRRLSSGTAWKGNVVCITKSGERIGLKATISPVRENGFCTGCTVVLGDSDSNLYELEKLSKSNSVYSRVLENCSDVLCQYDCQKKCLSYVSPSVSGLLGYDPQTVMKMSVSDLLDEKSLLTVRQRYIHLMSLGMDDLDLEAEPAYFDCSLINSGNGRVKVELLMVPVRSSFGNIRELVISVHDTTRARKQLKRLEESESKYRQIVENMGDVIWKLDPSAMCFSYISKSIFNLAGYTPEEILGKDIKEFFTAESYGRIASMVHQVMMRKSMFTMFQRFKSSVICKDRNVKELESEATFFASDDGRMELMGVSRDITNYKSYELKLRDAYMKIKFILDTVPARIFMKDKKNHYVMANKAFVDAMGVPSESLMGRDFISKNASPAIRAMYEQDEQVLASGKPVLNSEIFLKGGSDGGEWYSVSKVPYYNGDEVAGIIGIMTNITQQKHYERILVDANNQFASTIRNFSDAFVRTDLNGVVLMANPTACRFLGFDNEVDMLGKRLSSMVKGDLDWNKVKSGGNRKNVPLSFTNRLGRKLYFEASISVYNDKEGNPAGFESIARDVTERIMHEQQVRNMNRDMMKAFEQTKIKQAALESAQRKMTESLNYSKLIQDAILKPSLDTMARHLPDNMMLYLPREIVGGDFMYATEYGDGVLCAVADCTGHGVPGALMSVLAVSLLNDITSSHSGEVQVLAPSQILEILRSRTIATLSDTQVMGDGLDIGMFHYSKATRHLVFAGANLPLYVCRDGALVTHQPQKCPIGVFPISLDFVDYTFEAMPGDMLYMASDGFADQFGARGDSKYSLSRFRNLLTEASQYDVGQQQSFLARQLLEWQGSRKQTDDILVFGIRMP